MLFLVMLVVVTEGRPLEVGSEGDVEGEGEVEVDEEVEVVGGGGLCGEGRSYCEHPTNYPHQAILRAIHRQPVLVATMGLLGALEDEEGDREEAAEDVEEVNMGEDIVNENRIEDYEDYVEIDLYENGIVPY